MSDDLREAIRDVTVKLAKDYKASVRAAREKDSNQAGNLSESSWERLLKKWGPPWPVVSRRYVVGPGGKTNEIDLLILKPEYPPDLRDERWVLWSGVAAAFSVKTTLRRQHLTEALRQKERITLASSHRSLRDMVCGPFPFGLLAHSQKPRLDALEFNRTYQLARGALAGPALDLDFIAVADSGLWVTSRELLPAGQVGAARVTSWFGPWITVGDQDGSESLAAFIFWLRRQILGENDSLAAIADTYRGSASLSPLQTWPIVGIPPGLTDDDLRDNRGQPLLL